MRMMRGGIQFGWGWCCAYTGGLRHDSGRASPHLRRRLLKTPRHPSVAKARLEKTLKRTNKRIAEGWTDPDGQKARLEQRIAALTPKS
jgi:hypothetical protein